MKDLIGITPKTAQNLQLDSGIFVRGLTNPGEFGGELTEPAKTIGSTSGGGTISIIPTFRNIYEDLDGSRGVYKGGQVIDNWDIKMTVTIKEMTAENFKLALAAADTVTSGTGKYDVTSPRMSVEATDYSDNLCWIGKMAGGETPVIVELKNVLNTNGLSLTVADKATGTVALELTAHFDLNNPTEVPVKIYTPKI